MTNKDIEECILSDARFKESRLKSLYSNFDHLKESNIDGYKANILSWKWLILQLIKKEVFSHTLYINTSDLVLDLSLPSKNLQPHGLDKVLNVMINENKVLLTYDQFANNCDATSKIDYLKSFIPWYGSNQDKYIDIGIKSSGGGGGELKENIKLISKSQVDKYSELIFTYLEDNMNCDTPFLKTHIEEICLIEFNKKLDNFEIKCCLLNLIKQGKITKEIRDSIEIIWINYKKKKDIDENEEILNFEELQSICELKYSIFKISNHNKILNKRIDEIKFKIIENLKQNNEIDKKLIKSKLKIKLLLEKSIINSNNLLENLETTLINIENSKNNQFTKITLERNSKILKNLNNKIGNIKEIDLLINEINIENDKVIEISDKLSNITNKESTNIEIDQEDLEIENELKQLEIDEMNKQDLDDDKLMERFNKLKLNSNKSTESIEKDNIKDKIEDKNKDSNKLKKMEIAN
ncbi:hypothetical protein B5S32_g5106 [[Candida] boidinii]|nr:hypothetical protein B5S32_g5106 [[Candida] boidinii]